MDERKATQAIKSLRYSFVHRPNCHLHGLHVDIPIIKCDCLCHDRNVYSAGYAAGSQAFKDRCVALIAQCLERDPTLAKVAEAINDMWIE